MRPYRLPASFLCWCLWISLCLGCEKIQRQEAASEQAQAKAYKVIAIKDGDTVELLKDGKPLRVRLQGVDCPEKNQDFGTKARTFTSDLAFGKMVELVVHDIDRYGRTVGEIILPDGRNLNKELVRNGFAWHYTAYSKDQELAQLEAEARADKRGLWEHPSPVAPWDFRKNRKGSSTSQNSASAKPKKETTKTTAPTSAAQGEVYLCESKGSKTYHADRKCYLFEQCKSSTGTVSVTLAQQMNRIPCKVCSQ